MSGFGAGSAAVVSLISSVVGATVGGATASALTENEAYEEQDAAIVFGAVIGAAVGGAVFAGLLGAAISNTNKDRAPQVGTSSPPLVGGFP